MAQSRNSSVGPVVNPPRFPESPGRFPPEPPGPWHTPEIPPLWGDLPPPPDINTQAPVDPWFGWTLQAPWQQRPPVGPPMPVRHPNARHPVTGAPIWVPELGDAPLPPSWNAQSLANGTHPITGAPNYVPDQPPTGWWQPGQRPPPRP
jgi:hypothetical protein